MRRLDLRREPSLVWRAPALDEAVYATGTTPVGQVALTRRPAVRTNPQSAADGWEDWILSLRDERRMEVRGLAAPGYPARKLAKKGLEGSLDGVGFRLGVSSSLLQSRRSVRLEGASVNVLFAPRGLTVQLLEGGSVRGTRGPTGWDLSHPTDSAVLAVCLFEWAEMDHFLRTPGLRAL